MSVPLDFRPSNEKELAQCLADPFWRIGSGALYKIIASKGRDEGDEPIIPFVPNQAQWELIRGLWTRNIVLKARQRGITTAIAIMWLDHALFNANQRCAVIAQDLASAEAIFRDKVKFAYDRLPEQLRKLMPLQQDRADELLFAHNNSSVKVTSSARSGTVDRLHVSEFGKICAEFPKKATEIVRGSFPAIPENAITIIESTAEGADGIFYDMSQRAIELHDSKAELSKKDYRFHFYPWYSDPDYVLNDNTVVISETDHEYFNGLEGQLDIVLSPEQRAWYVATRMADFGGDPQSMWQEYPSFPAESFKVSTDGVYYNLQLSDARKNGRITAVPHVAGTPVNTFWDIGASDGTGVWLHQQVGLMHRFIGYIEGWGESYSYYASKLQQLGYVWGTHYLPHDAAHKRQQGEVVQSPKDELEKLGLGGRWEIVPAVTDVTHGIQLMRDKFSQCWFDEAKCKEGLSHLANYRKEWNRNTGRWKDTPRHDIHSEAADSIRQFAQSFKKLEAASNKPKIVMNNSWVT